MTKQSTIDNVQSTICQLPKHIGIIMDGNRRWAKKRLLPVALGHKKGAEVFRSRVSDMAEMGIENATFYALSTENLSRQEDEVDNLMRLFDAQLSDLKSLTNKDNIRLKFIGDLSVFNDKIRIKAENIEQDSANNNGLTCRLALNYGAKAEIVRAANKCRSESRSPITEKMFNDLLYTSDAPDVDLIIRTGGEKRLSNFLLWQAAYAELYFTDVLWCDFTKSELIKALDDFSERNRRHGK